MDQASSVTNKLTTVSVQAQIGYSQTPDGMVET